jgi:hypothetical protein
MTQKHTPGPWFVTPDDYAVYEKDGYGYRGDTICTVPAGDRLTRAANARAIAALPDLLAALEGLLGSDLVKWFPPWPPEGNTEKGPPWSEELKQRAAPLLAARAAIAKARGV